MYFHPRFSGIIYNSADDEMNAAKKANFELDLKEILSKMDEPVGMIAYMDNQVGGNQDKIWREEFRSDWRSESKIKIFTDFRTFFSRLVKLKKPDDIDSSDKGFFA